MSFLEKTVITAYTLAEVVFDRKFKNLREG